MIQIDMTLRPTDLEPALDAAVQAAATSVALLRERRQPGDGAPVYTEAGRYTSRGWTEWTQGFQFGIPLLIHEYLRESGGDIAMLEYGRTQTLERMAGHLTHTGVHDHGFNNVSTYGTLLRLGASSAYEAEFYRLALKASAAVQASRWTPLPDGPGFVHSFNGPHSLFSDTIRSMRVLALGYLLGHELMAEQDEHVSLLGRLLAHAEATARYNVYFGTGRDSYDIRGRVVHESIFNTQSGSYRCPSTQQGYSPFTTWTRGLSWILCGYPEELEFLDLLSDEDIRGSGYGAHQTVTEVRARWVEVATAVADFFLEQTPTDGVPYWDTGAPGLVHLGDCLNRPAEPFNKHEPVDSSAAAICAQGLVRLGRYLAAHGDAAAGNRYFQAGLSVTRTLLSDTYIARAADHEGLLLHSVYHQPNGWDYVAPGQSVPNGESCMWGDYHLMELAVYVKRLAEGAPPPRFFDGVQS